MAVAFLISPQYEGTARESVSKGTKKARVQ